MSDFQPQEDDDAGGSFTPGKPGRLPYFKFFEDFEELRRIRDALCDHLKERCLVIPLDDTFRKGQSTDGLKKRGKAINRALGRIETTWPDCIRNLRKGIENWLVINQQPQSEELITDLTRVVVRNASRWYRERNGKANWEGLLRSHLNAYKSKNVKIDNAGRLGGHEEWIPETRHGDDLLIEAIEQHEWIRRKLKPRELKILDVMIDVSDLLVVNATGERVEATPEEEREEAAKRLGIKVKAYQVARSRLRKKIIKILSRSMDR